MTDLAKKLSDMGDDKLQCIEDVVKTCPAGNFLEIGTRLGGSMAVIMENMPQGSLAISVDPYGAKPFVGWQGEIVNEFTDQYYLQAIKELSTLALQSNKDFVQYKMTSLDYLNNEAMIWLKGTEAPLAKLKYSFVLLDGDHTDEVVGQEIELLKPRMVEGGIILVDNRDWLKSVDFDGWVTLRFDMVYFRF
jgi:hypothetical protein